MLVSDTMVNWWFKFLAGDSFLQIKMGEIEGRRERRKFCIRIFLCVCVCVFGFWDFMVIKLLYLSLRESSQEHEGEVVEMPLVSARCKIETSWQSVRRRGESNNTVILWERVVFMVAFLFVQITMFTYKLSV